MTLTTNQWMVVGGYTLISLGICTAIGGWVYTKLDFLNREVDRLARKNAKMQDYIDKRDKDGWERPPVKRQNGLDMTREIHIKKHGMAGLEHWDG